MNPYIVPGNAFETPDSDEIRRLVQRGKRLRAEAVAESAQGLVAWLRGLIASGRDKSAETAANLASKPQGSLT